MRRWARNSTLSICASSAIGDDRTDEDLFGALPTEAITIKVGPGDTKARFRVDGVPFFIIAGKITLAGAQPPDAFLEGFNQAIGR